MNAVALFGKHGHVFPVDCIPEFQVSIGQHLGCIDRLVFVLSVGCNFDVQSVFGNVIGNLGMFDLMFDENRNQQVRYFRTIDRGTKCCRKPEHVFLGLFPVAIDAFVNQEE